jgi:hypothetical protein
MQVLSCAFLYSEGVDSVKALCFYNITSVFKESESLVLGIGGQGICKIYRHPLTDRSQIDIVVI